MSTNQRQGEQTRDANDARTDARIDGSTDGSGEGPLAGTVVLDMTTSYAGPTASMYLADLGADVIKVEKPGGDDARQWGPPFLEGNSAWFASANRGKRSIEINIRSAEGIAELHQLIARADVFMENLNPTKLAKHGLDPETLRAKHPGLIYCAVSGFGLTGPDASAAGYDLVAQARSGIMSVTGARDGSPQRVSTALSDVVTGMNAVAAICAALVQKHRTGRGDTIDVSLLDSDLALMAPRISSYLAGEPEPAPSGGTDSVLAVYQSFRTADRDIVVAIGNDSLWLRFCEVIERPDLGADAGSRTNADRRARRPELIEAIQSELHTRTSEQWLAALRASGIPCSPVKFLHEVVADEQVRARGALVPLEHFGGTVGVHAPYRFESWDVQNRRVPKSNEHGEEIRRELAAEVLVTDAATE